MVRKGLNEIYLDHVASVNTTKAIQDDGGNAELNELDHENWLQITDNIQDTSFNSLAYYIHAQLQNRSTMDL